MDGSVWLIQMLCKQRPRAARRTATIFQSGCSRFSLGHTADTGSVANLQSLFASFSSEKEESS
jgi:hypothetical protein